MTILQSSAWLLETKLRHVADTGRSQANRLQGDNGMALLSGMVNEAFREQSSLDSPPISKCGAVVARMTSILW